MLTDRAARRDARRRRTTESLWRELDDLLAKLERRAGRAARRPYSAAAGRVARAVDAAVAERRRCRRARATGWPRVDRPARGRSRGPRRVAAPRPAGRARPSGAVTVSTGPRRRAGPAAVVAQAAAGGRAGRSRVRRTRRPARPGLGQPRRRGRPCRRRARDPRRGRLDEAALQCPPDLPSAATAMLAWVRAGGVPAAVCHNCSGKHAAMLATCVAAGWPVASYRRPGAPAAAGDRRPARDRWPAPSRAAAAVDGCGAPAFALPLRRARARLRAPGHGRRTARRPWSLPRSGRIRGWWAAPAVRVTELIADVPGLVAKEGAEGVWAAALPDGRAFAAKLEDGAGRGLPP